MGLQTSVLTAAAVATAVASSASAVTVGGGGSLIAGPYDSDYNYTLDSGVTSAFGDPGTGSTGDWFAVNPEGEAFLHRFSNDGSAWMWVQNNVDATGRPVYVQWNRPTAYSVGTIIHDATKYPYDDAGGTANYTIKVAAGNPGLTTAAWASTPIAGMAVNGVTNTAKVVVSTLPAVVSGNTLRAEFSSTTFRSPADANGIQNSHAFIQEITVLPDRYLPIPITSNSTSGAGAFPPENAYDGDTFTRWFHQSGGDEFIELGFGGEQRVDAVVVYAYNGFPSDFSIVDDASNVLATVSGLTGAGATPTEVVPVKLNSPALTSSLRLVFAPNSSQVDGVGGVTEIIPLQLVPEPTALSALSLLPVTLIRRRRSVLS